MVVAVLILFVTIALAQDTPKVEVFGGYAYTNVDTKDLGNRQSFNGWDVDVAARINKNFSIVGDFSGAYKSETIDLGTVTPVGTHPALSAMPRVSPTTAEGKIRLYNYLFGPRFSFETGKITPFVEGLFGVARTTISASASGVSASVSSNGFGMALGGGLDYNASKRVAIRLVKFDYMMHHLSYNNADFGLNVSENLNNFRIATGIVFKF
jgi:opacity protein-like surface antigen